MQVTLYNLPNFGGTSQQLSIGRHDVDVLKQPGGIGNDQLRSLQIPNGLEVRLFRHKEYVELLSTYQTDVPRVTDEDVGTSSLIVALLPGYYYYLKAEHSGSVLDVALASKEEGAKLIQHKRHDSENQQFEFTPLKDGSYKISNRLSQKVLSVTDSSSEMQAGIVQQTWADQDHQRWALAGQPGGSYKFVNTLSGKAIDIQGGRIDDSVDAIQNADADSKSQRFFIEPVAIEPKPVNLVITPPGPICWNERADLTALAITAGSDAGDLAYFLDEAAQQPLVTPHAIGSGTYYIRLTTSDGRAVVKSVEVLVRNKPELTVVPPAPYCADKTVNLATTVTSPVGPTDKLDFFQDEALTQLLSNPTQIGQSGTYYIRLTDKNGCSVSAPVEVVVNPLPKLELLASEWAYQGETVDLTAPYITNGSEPGTLAYFGPNDSQVPLTPEQATSVGAGTYYLQLTGANGCPSVLKAIIVTLEERPSIAVPMHVDGQYIEQKTSCAAPRVDFSRLPYNDGTRDINPYTPYVGEELEAVPFTDGTFALLPGVHLHWALPDFLTRSFRHPLLQLEALRRATRTNRLGEPQPADELFDQLYTYFREIGWVKEIPGNALYASILADKEAIDVAISEGLGSPDPNKQALAHEILRVRSLLEPGGTQMPPVPNRWRVVRAGDGPVKTWVVESDFLVGASSGDHQTGVPFPDYTPSQTPYGWLGRRYEGSVAPKPEGGDYLAMPLTALGYGDPTFAAFYPNCHSVFGLHDETAEPGKTYTYDIAGYYEPKNPDTDPQNADIEFFELLRKDLTNRTQPNELRPALSAFLREHLQLPMADPRPGVWPDQLVCCGRLSLTANPATPENPAVTVTVGNTSTEAVSAYLADRLSPSKKEAVEEYLEALQYLSRLDHLQTDIGPKLREERHRQGFSSEKSGSRWVFAPRQATDDQAEQTVEQSILTDDKAHFLHLLNGFQLAFDRTDEQVKALRQQIFADWTKYMLCQYPPDGADDTYPDADEARFFIDYELMPALDQLNEQRQQAAKALRDHVAGFWHVGVSDVRAPAGLYAGLVQLPDVAPYLSAAAGGSEVALVQCLNTYIDQYGYQDPMAQQADGVHTWTLEDILERQHYETHLRTNRLRLENAFPNNLAQHPDLVLLRKPHSPFHRPTDPVVMLTGDALKTTRKHGQDGLLPNELWVLNGGNLLDEAARMAPQLIPEDWQRPPGRHPLLLDWLVEFFPVEDTDFNFDRYEPNYLLDKYELALNAVDLSAAKTDPSATDPQLYTGVGQTFWGSCLLTTGGSKSLRQSLETFLMGELGLTEADLTDPATIRQAFFQNASGKDAWLNHYQQEKGMAVSPDTFDDFYGWEPDNWQPDGPPPAELAALWTTKHKALAALAYEQLCQTDFLAQALGGFTTALLMLKEGVQLRVADPLGYPEYQAFSQRVNEAVGLLNQASTLPNNPFFPIRAGAAKLLELRLLDTFGLDIVHLRDIQGVIAAETLRPQHSAHHIELTPRLSQAARLNFHWLSATDNAVEQSEHPASSPICGWVLANLLDESLMIYAQTGAALGYVDREGHWRSAPGQRPAILAEGIPNWHLRRMVLWLMAKANEARLLTDGKSDTIPHFIGQLSEALIRVEPARSDHAGQGVAMLMSRPLALVRATVGLELKGAPAVNQSWAQFRQVIGSPGQKRESTLDLEQVALPLRIGEDHQLNDGLVGFWVDADDGYAYRDDAFRIPSLHRATSGTRDDTDDHLLDTLTLGADGNRGRAITLNLLMDPHGSVHATCGILPVNELSLPPDLYAKALEQLEITFLTAPLLTPQQMIHLSLPPEPGFQWAWLDTDRQRWREVSTVGHFRRDELVAVFGGAGTLLWDQLIERGWVTLEGDQAVMVPPGRRPATDDFPPAQLAPLLNHFLATRQINPFQMVPGGNSGQELREGWLRLRPLPDSPPLPTDQPTPA